MRNVAEKTHSIRQFRSKVKFYFYAQGDLRKISSFLCSKENEYLHNALNMTIFGTNYAFSKLREKVSFRTAV